MSKFTIITDKNQKVILNKDEIIYVKAGHNFKEIYIGFKNKDITTLVFDTVTERDEIFDEIEDWLFSYKKKVD